MPGSVLTFATATIGRVTQLGVRCALNGPAGAGPAAIPPGVSLVAIVDRPGALYVAAGEGMFTSPQLPGQPA